MAIQGESVVLEGLNFTLREFTGAAAGRVASAPGRMRLAYARKGAFIAELGGERRLADSPTLLCCGEGGELILSARGAGEASLIEFAPRVVNSRFDAALLRAGRFESDTDMQDAYYLGPFVAAEGGRCLALPLLPSRARSFEALLGSLRTAVADRGNAFWPCRSRSFLLELLFQLRFELDRAGEGDARAAPLAPGLEDEIASRALLIIHDRYAEKLSLEAIAREAGSNRTTLLERFRRATGCSVMEYLQKHRLALAMVLLRDTMLTVQEVCWRVGFGDAAHFGRAFKRAASMSPSEYRGAHSWMLREGRAG